MATNGRLRDYLTRAEVRALLLAAKSGDQHQAFDLLVVKK
jgi:hypothetical protein